MDDEHPMIEPQPHLAEQTTTLNAVDVYLRVSFSKIYDIDTLNQRFSAEAIIESKWHDPTRESAGDDLTHVKNRWRPDLYVENVVSDLKEELSAKSVWDGELRQVMVSEIRRVRGLFWESLELAAFPCDIQDLSLIVTTKKSGKRVNLILMQPRLAYLSVPNTLEKTMWHLHQVVETEEETIEREYSFGKRDYPAVRLTCQAFRLPAYFHWNLMLPILLITCAALGPFVIDYKIPQSRLPSTATMLLSSVSFKAVIARSLPTVSYLTSLDKYSLGSIAIITAMLVYHALIAALSNSCLTLFGNDLIYYFDKLAFLLFFGLIVSKNLLYFYWLCKIKSYQENLKLNKLFHHSKHQSEQSLFTSSNKLKIN